MTLQKSAFNPLIVPLLEISHFHPFNKHALEMLQKKVLQAKYLSVSDKGLQNPGTLSVSIAFLPSAFMVPS